MKRVKSVEQYLNLSTDSTKYLILIHSKELEHLEKRDKVYLGTRKIKKQRPALLWKKSSETASYLKLVFLTSSKVSPAKVDLSLCVSKEKLCRNFPFNKVSFIFQDKEANYLCFKLKTLELIQGASFCGPCHDLEFLEELKFKEM